MRKQKETITALSEAISVFCFDVCHFDIVFCTVCEIQKFCLAHTKIFEQGIFEEYYYGETKRDFVAMFLNNAPPVTHRIWSYVIDGEE